jgi:hypothetical protein
MPLATMRSRRHSASSKRPATLVAIPGMLAALAWAPDALGVVVADDDEMSAPLNGYIGSWNGSSAVCIGPNWIISAKHVGGNVGSVFTMRGVQYRAVEIVPHPVQDIELIRVAEVLPGYHRIATGVASGDIAVLGGWGVTAGGAYDNGYDWSGPRRETWGANTIEGVGSLMSIRFDDPATPAAVPHESIYAVNDSGAGLFVYGVDGSLELAGVAVSVTGFGTSVYGNWAFSLNLGTLRTWIMPIANPGAPITSSVEAPRASLFTGGAPSVIWAAAVIGGAVLGRRRRIASPSLA